MVGRRVEGMVAARYVRPLWATLVGLALVCGSAPVARPCTTLECPELIVIPRDGGVVPANLPGLRLMLVANPLSTDLTRAEEGLPLEEVSLRVQDESGRIVPVEQDGPTFFFVEPLEAHRRYEVSISAPFSCSWHQTTAFETVDAAPLPEALGTVVGREITVTDYEENECSAAQRVRDPACVFVSESFDDTIEGMQVRLPFDMYNLGAITLSPFPIVPCPDKAGNLPASAKEIAVVKWIYWH